MRIHSAEVVPTINLVTELRRTDADSLPQRVEVKNTQFVATVADIIYTQRAFIQAIRVKGSRLDVTL